MASLVLRAPREPASGVFAVPGVFRKAAVGTVAKPGSRGGHIYHTGRGTLRYGTPAVTPGRASHRHGSTPILEPAWFTTADYRSVRDEVLAWSDKPEEGFGRRAFTRRNIGAMASEKIASKFFVVGGLWSDGHLAAIYALERDGLDQGMGMDPGIYRHLMCFATGRPGFGRAAMRQVLGECARTNTGVVLNSSPNAKAFYLHLGFRETPEDPEWVYLTAEEVKGWLQRNP